MRRVRRRECRAARGLARVRRVLGGDVEAYRRAVKDGLERRVLELLR